MSGRGNLKMVEKAQRVAGVFASDEVSFAQGLDGPQGDVAKVTDREWGQR